jgi:hypothetical protein
VKTTIIALSAAALVVAVPAVFAQGVSSKTPGHEMQHKLSKKRHPGPSGYAQRRQMQTKGYPGAFGYAPGVPSASQRDMTDISPQAGGGGGGGGGGM